MNRALGFIYTAVLVLLHGAAAGPALERVLEMAISDPAALAQEIRESPLASVVEFGIDEVAHAETVARENGVPLVFAHGM